MPTQTKGTEKNWINPPKITSNPYNLLVMLQGSHKLFGKPGKSPNKVPYIEKSWNLKKNWNNHGKFMEFCE